MTHNADLIQALRAALESTPDSVPLRRHLADLLLADGQAAEAVKEYRRALDLSPNDDELKLVLAQAYYTLGKADVALVILEELLRHPTPAAAIYQLAARAYAQTGEPAAALRAYRQALAADPTLADAELERQLGTAQPVAPPVVKPATLPLPSLPQPPAPEPPRVLATKEGDGGGSLSAVERPRITFKDVGGMEKVKEEIRMKIIYPLTHPELFKAYGKTLGGGILMYGPPGCGKTYLARATAGEVQAGFIALGLHDILDMYIGNSEQNLHQAFELARSNVPCVLFFDEADALGASRADMRYSVARQLINQFLMEMDGVNTSNEGVLILAATNAPWHMDAALRRPGRFDRVIFVPPPDAEARSLIFQLLLAAKPTSGLDFNRLARETAGFSGADIKGVVDRAVEAKLRAAMQQGVPTPLTTADLLAVIKTVQPTVAEWFATARNYALYSNEGGVYDDVLEYLKQSEGGGLFSRRRKDGPTW